MLRDLRGHRRACWQECGCPPCHLGNPKPSFSHAPVSTSARGSLVQACPTQPVSLEVPEVRDWEKQFAFGEMKSPDRIKFLVLDGPSKVGSTGGASDASSDS